MTIPFQTFQAIAKNTTSYGGVMGGVMPSSMFPNCEIEEPKRLVNMTLRLPFPPGHHCMPAPVGTTVPLGDELVTSPTLMTLTLVPEPIAMTL